MQLDSRALKHIPLLEGEEKVKYLNLQNNDISRMENLVSLPNLHFLDMSSNKLAEIGASIAGLTALRVLILSKNMISSVNAEKGEPSIFGGLNSLDMLDLHDNRIQGSLDLAVTGIGNLQNLRILNLSNN